MKQESTDRRSRLVRELPDLTDILRGSLLQRVVRHRQGCTTCEQGKGHPVAVLAVTYPGRHIRHISLRGEQVGQVERQLENYHRLRDTLEQICELNQQGLRGDRKNRKRGGRRRG